LSFSIGAFWLAASVVLHHTYRRFLAKGIARADAESTTERMNKLKSRFDESIASAIIALQDAARHLPECEHAFSVRAFPSFWDASNATYDALESAAAVLHRATEAVIQYRDTVRDRDHSFPALSLTKRFETLDHLATKYANIIALAERDYEFVMTVRQSDVSSRSHRPSFADLRTVADRAKTAREHLLQVF
jgi:hypothetical protein